MLCYRVASGPAPVPYEPNARGVQPKVESRVERLPNAAESPELSSIFSAVASNAIECWDQPV